MNNNSSIFGNTEIKMSAHRESRPEIVANRRNFLKKLAVFAGSSGVLTSMPWWSPLRADPPGGSALDRVRLGVIGVGSRGQKLMLHLLQTPGVEIAAVCDDYEPHYKRAIEETGGKAKAFYDYRKLLEMKLPVASYGVSKKEIHDHHSINCCNCFFGLPCFLT